MGTSNFRTLPSFSGRLIVLFVTILIFSAMPSFAQDWVWDQEIIDFSVSENDEILADAQLAIKIDGVDVPYFVYKNDNGQLCLIYDSNQATGYSEVEWSMDTEFFSDIPESEYWDVDVEGSVIRYAYMFEDNELLHFRSLTRDYSNPDPGWIADESMNVDADYVVYDPFVSVLCRDLDGDGDSDWAMLCSNQNSDIGLFRFYNNDEYFETILTEMPGSGWGSVIELSASGLQLDEDSGSELILSYETYYYVGGGNGYLYKYRQLVNFDEENNPVIEPVESRFYVREKLSSVILDDDSPVIFGNHDERLVTYQYSHADSTVSMTGLWSEPVKVMNLKVDETGISPEYIVTQQVEISSGGSSSTVTYYTYDIWSPDESGIGWKRENLLLSIYCGNGEYHQGYLYFDNIIVAGEERPALFFMARLDWEDIPVFVTRLYYKNTESGNWEIFPGYESADLRSDFVDMNGDDIFERLDMNEEWQDSLYIEEFIYEGDDWAAGDNWTIQEDIHHSVIYGDFDGNGSIDILSYDGRMLVNTVAPCAGTPTFIIDEDPFPFHDPNFDTTVGFSHTYNWMPVDWDNDGDTDLYSYQNNRLLINSSTTDVNENKETGLPDEITLGSAYPNPFNPSTTIPFTLNKAGKIQITVYDILGKQVALLANDSYQAGDHTISWNTTNNHAISSGVYFLQLKTQDVTRTRKLVLCK